LKKYICILLLSHFLTAEALAQPTGTKDDYKNNLGISIGIPYTTGLTYERLITPTLSVQAHAGYFVVVQSLGIKLNWYPLDSKILPYFFLGDALVGWEAQDYGDPDGISNYVWFGCGLSYSIKRIKLFIEASGLILGNEEKGLGDNWIFPFSPSVGGGVCFRF